VTTRDASQDGGPLRPRGGPQELRLAPGHPRLARAREGRVVTGLCAGIAAFTGYRAGAVRAVFVAAALVTLGTVAVGYLALSALVPAAAD